MKPETGSISFRIAGAFYTQHFSQNGWIAAEMVQYLGDIYASSDPKVGVLKLLGYTLEMGPSAPDRESDHWVEVDLDSRTVETNSEVIRRSVKREDPPEDAPYGAYSLKRIYEALDSRDFTVRLFK